MFQSESTPLMFAATNGHLPVVEYLVERGADMEAKDNIVSDVSLISNHTYKYCERVRMGTLH